MNIFWKLDLNIVSEGSACENTIRLTIFPDSRKFKFDLAQVNSNFVLQVNPSARSAD